MDFLNHTNKGFAYVWTSCASIVLSHNIISRSMKEASTTTTKVPSGPSGQHVGRDAKFCVFTRPAQDT
ncbi:MAG: hypothetical protein LBS43_10710 [Prevotellaceae bacterium]|nr:hypothetical protein [Prevotellaceae bacterium]